MVRRRNLGKRLPRRPRPAAKRSWVPRVLLLVLFGVALGLLIANVYATKRAVETTTSSTDAVPEDSEPTGVAASPVQVENARRGTRSWQRAPAPAGSIEGYSSVTSVLPGSSVSFHVSTTPAASYRIELYRLGWYRGAGARLVGCLPSCSRQKQGAAQPAPVPALTGEVRANWPLSDQLTVPEDWLSGYYVAKLVLTSGRDRGKAASIPFIVRAPSTRQSLILVQAPVNTWQAYNGWGGKSLYDFDSRDGVPATRVSFDRPYVGEQILNNPFSWEYQLVRFLEREGYDVSYATNVDVHRDRWGFKSTGSL